ncbi:acylphosphatase [Oceanobacillus oncorhynchi subsp. oncorhynchi]
MKSQDAVLLPTLTKKVVKGITGFQLCSYTVALEGWRRGLELKWYSDETGLCKLHSLNSTTHGKYFSLSDGDRTHYFLRSRGDKVSNNTVNICQNKEKTKAYMRESNVPVPLGEALEKDEDIIHYANRIGYPVIIKPIDGSMGTGVYTNISDEKTLVNILKELRSKYSYREYLLEKHYDGKEYRIYVVGDKVIGATNRIPANVVGNGIDSVKQLIEIKNKKRKKNPYLSPKPIKVDYEVTYMLERAGYTLDSVLKEGEQIFLREKSNLSSGGDSMEATDELSDEVKQIAVDSLKALPSIPHAGVDIIVDSKDNKKGVVLEVNATAEIGFHLFPLVGEAKDVPEAIIDYYFPETIGAKKSRFYFDYLSILEPLKSGVADEIKVAPTPLNKQHAKKYMVTGELSKVNYMKVIKRRALEKNLFGYVKQINENTVEIYLVGESREEVNAFKDDVKEGSQRSVVETIEEEDLELSNRSRKMGFYIIAKK